MTENATYPPVLDLSDPKKVLIEIFDNDVWVKDAYLASCNEQLAEVCKNLALAFQKFEEFHTIPHTEQSIYVSAFMHGVLDDIVTSLKLIVSGKMVPSGNLMRQAIEGLALATLCSSNQLLVIPLRKGQSTTAKYWEQVKKEDYKVESHHAVSHLEANRITLNVKAEIIEVMKEGRKRYNKLSHPGVLTIQFRVAELSKKFTHFIGGTFDTTKVEFYQAEILARAGLCNILPSAIQLMMNNLKNQT